jgi:hypothetical protein
LEQRFHDYFYTGETELRLSHLVVVKQRGNKSVGDYVVVKQRGNKSVGDYVRRFRDTRNTCYGLTIRDRDFTEYAFAGLSVALRDKMEG